MFLRKASLWIVISILIKISVGLFMIKLLAVSFGPSGVGQAGNFRQLITMLSVLSGAGIFNGVTKYIAQYHDNTLKLRTVIGTSSAIIQGFSIFLAIIFLLTAAPISQNLFGNIHYTWIVRLVALVQIGIAWTNLLLAIMKGFSDVIGNALSIIIGNIIGVVVYYACYLFCGYSGILLGLLLIPALIVIPAIFIIKFENIIPFYYLWPKWDTVFARQLSKFSIMALITHVTLHISYIMMRNFLAIHYSWDEVGVWQGVSSISDVYLQLITAFFSVYLLPTLSKISDKKTIINEIIRSLRFFLPIVSIISFIVWLLRDVVILLFFSANFATMRDLFAWQQIGDILKIGSYVFGYLVIAKASLLFYFLAEVMQCILLTFFSHWLIPNNGALGATQAYMATYIVYFSFCCSAFIIWCGRHEL